MSLVATVAPDFTAKAVMPDNCIEDFTLSSLRGKYVVLFFYPMDFTFVCPTELVAFDNSIEKFRALNTELVSVSVDSEYSHYAWKTTERSKGGVGKLRYPMVHQGDQPQLRNSAQQLGRAPRPLPDRPGRRGAARDRQRPAAGPERRRGAPHGQGAAVHRKVRRSLPGQLARRLRRAETHRGRRRRLPCPSREVISRETTKNLPQPFRLREVFFMVELHLSRSG